MAPSFQIMDLLQSMNGLFKIFLVLFKPVKSMESVLMLMFILMEESFMLQIVLLFAHLLLYKEASTAFRHGVILNLRHK